MDLREDYVEVCSVKIFMIMMLAYHDLQQHSTGQPADFYDAQSTDVDLWNVMDDDEVEVQLDLSDDEMFEESDYIVQNVPEVTASSDTFVEADPGQDENADAESESDEDHDESRYATPQL